MNIRDFIKGKIAVKCETEGEYRIFLQDIEDEGILWASSEKPTSHYNYWNGSPIILYCDSYELLFQRGDYSFSSLDIIPFKDLNIVVEDYRLKLGYKANKIFAILEDKDGTYIKDFVTEYEAKDKSDFEIGKKMAIKKLFDIKDNDDEMTTKHGIRLETTLDWWGVVGEQTDLEAFGNIKLYVGDVVEFFDLDGKSIGLRCVCKCDSYPNGFIAGAAGASFVNGISHKSVGDFLIVKRKSYTEMVVGDIIDDIKYVAY